MPNNGSYGGTVRVSKRKKGEWRGKENGSQQTYRDGKGKATHWFRAHLFEYTSQRGRARVPSILTIPTPPRRIKSYTIPIFPGSVCISRLCLWKPERQARLPRSRVFMNRKKNKNKRRACTRVHMFVVRSRRSVHERMVWGMVELCDILQDCHTTFSLRHARAPEKAFPSTTGELFRLSNRSFRSPFSFSLDKKKLALA